MIQNQYFYVPANSNYKSLKKTVFAVNYFHFQFYTNFAAQVYVYYFFNIVSCTCVTIW